jgi:hypothetical protein
MIALVRLHWQKACSVGPGLPGSGGFDADQGKAKT